jgi:MFS family permease
MMPLTGWLTGRFGIKYVFLVSVISFTLASALCGAATSLSELVLFRAVQGVAGAGLIPLSQATLLQINPPERHGHAMAVFGIGTIMGPIMGPALGGWLTYLTTAGAGSSTSTCRSACCARWASCDSLTRSPLRSILGRTVPTRG